MGTRNFILAPSHAVAQYCADKVDLAHSDWAWISDIERVIGLRDMNIIEASSVRPFRAFEIDKEWNRRYINMRARLEFDWHAGRIVTWTRVFMP